MRTSLRSGSISLFFVASTFAASAFAEGAPPQNANGGAPSPDAAIEAKARFNEGLALHDSGKDEDARLKFAQAYAVLHNPNILFNLARSEQLSGHPLEALGHMREYLAMDDPGVKPAMREKMLGYEKEVSGQLGHVIAEGPPGSRLVIDGTPRSEVTPMRDPVDVEPGRHFVELVTPAETRLRVNVDVPAGQITRTTLGPTTPVYAPVPPPPIAPTYTPGGQTITGQTAGTQYNAGGAVYSAHTTANGNYVGPVVVGTAPEQDDTTIPTGRKVGAVLLGIAAVTTGVVGGLYIHAADRDDNRAAAYESQAQAATPGNGSPCNGVVSDACNAFRDAQNQHDNNQLAGGLFVGAGAIAAVTAVVLLAIPGEKTAKKTAILSPSVQPLIGKGTGGFAFKASF